MIDSILLISDQAKERFWAKVAKGRSDECWLWTACLHKFGYGLIYVNHSSEGAHRVSWLIHNNTIPDGMSVLHNCPGGDNPACVNPAHLWLGTQADNMKDRSAKGRCNPARGQQHQDRMRQCAARGDNHVCCKLKTDDCLDILNLRKQGWSYRALADLFGVARSTIRYTILRRELV